MAARTQTDSVEWMRQQWVEHGEPQPSRFAAMSSILRTQAVVTAALDRVLKEQGLTRRAYLVLVTLQMSRDDTRPLGQISTSLLVHPTTVTLVIDGLEKNGLVRREPHPSDRRTILASLTAAGRVAVAEANAALAEIGFGLNGTSDAEADEISAALRAVRQNLDDFG